MNSDSSDYKELLDILDTETQKTNGLIDELIEWGQLLMNENTNLLESKLLKPIIDTEIAFLKQQSDAKNLEIQNNADEKVKIICNERSIKVIIRNLLANAIKFTPTGGKITFSTEDNGQKIALLLEDSGIGMSKEVIEKIFVNNEFYKSNGTNKEKGSGLGLQIIKDMIQKNKAELKVTSIVEKGTVFTLIIDKSI
jgi:signal transduction histidine kinase